MNNATTNTLSGICITLALVFVVAFAYVVSKGLGNVVELWYITGVIMLGISSVAYSFFLLLELKYAERFATPELSRRIHERQASIHAISSELYKWELSNTGQMVNLDHIEGNAA